MKYNYDESGVTFYYFLISVLGLVLVPLTVSPLFALKTTFSSDIRKKKKVILVHKTKKSPSFKWALIFFGWGLLSFVTYRVMTTEVPNENLWDPYNILNIVEGTDLPGIKKTYRKLSLKFHPDKIRGKSEEEVAQINEKYVEITKAYKALTDDTIRANFEEFGHPDGRQSLSLGIALPAWLVEAHNNIWVLSVYGLILGLLMPFYVGKWWYKSNKYTRDQILNQSMAIYFRNLKENMPMRDLIELLSASNEFKEEVLVQTTDHQKCEKIWSIIKSEAEKEATILEEPRLFTMDYCYKAASLIYAQLYRVPIKDDSLLEDQQKVIRRCLSLIYGFIQVTLSQNWIQTTIMAIDLSQMIVQAVPYKASPLLQLPNLTSEIIRRIRGQKSGLKNVLELMKLEDKERRALLTQLSDSEYKETIQVGLQFPVLRLIKCSLKVIDDAIITPNAIITCIIKLKLVTVEQFLSNTTETCTDVVETDASLVDDEDAHVKSFLSKASQSHLVPPVYAPYFPDDKRVNWWVIIGDLRNGRMLVNPSKVSDLVDETTLKFQFQGPPEAGSFSFNLFIKSDSYLGIDLREELELTVVPSSQLPEESEPDDEISEPEVGSMASQMAQMRNGEEGEESVVAAPLGDDDTSSDEE